MTATITDLLHDSAAAWPDRLAVSTPTGVDALRYRDLEALAAELAAQLRWSGVQEGDAVAIVSDNSLEYVLALFAITTLGAAAAPLNPQLAALQLRHRLDSLRARAAIVPARLYGDFVSAYDGLTLPILELSVARRGCVRPEAVITGSADPEREPLESGRRVAESPRGGETALLMLTSGTTTTPKIVPLTHANLLAAIRGIRDVYRLTPEDSTLLAMPLSHGHGLIAGLLTTLASGGTAVLPTGGRFHASTFWSDMTAARATWYTAVPTIHQILLACASSDYPTHGAPALRFIRSCSAPLAPAVLQDLETAFGAPVLEAYGMTETAHQVASNPLPGAGPHKPGSVGVPTGVELRVATPRGEWAAVGQSGEIWIRGAAVTSGYLNNPQANRDSFTDGWFRTGDLGCVDGDGYLFLTGRVKEIINRGGEKVSPAAVDLVLQSNPHVEDALSFAVPDEKYGEDIEAAVVLRPGHTVSEDELERYARCNLSAFEVPRRIFVLPDLPRTDKGAGDRRRLAQLLDKEGGR